ncbi:hypothetical protein ALC57_12224 [Trachymyrmex cornetzi]|uniref:Mutator-like transposase domain-containing protein n=1 Tax=Trachymyrmex cornetzi TaxID=471704 RepID=A0A151J169_9HYME|nr:hypothetical protein ALC57_12224 [Trachymyrmex cornetzi]
MDKKSTKFSSARPSRPKKRKFSSNQHTSEQDTSSTSSSASKLSKKSPEFEVNIDQSVQYVIINFALFLTLQTLVICKVCKSDIRFYKYSEKGLGFKLVVQCKCETETCIPSSPEMNTTYEINRRFVYAMRLIGVGFQGLSNFCGFMDIANKIKLSKYYELTVRRHSNSVEDMRNAIWATFYHKISTDSEPQHSHCPEGANSWCKYRVAEATGTLENFKHPPALNNEIQPLLHGIYEDLTSDDLLQRCLGANTQNNNESYNACVWHFAPKHTFSGKQIIEIAAFCAACNFNEGFKPLLKIMEVMGVVIGKATAAFAEERDRARIASATRRTSDVSKERRIEIRNEKLINNELFEDTEGIVYGPGIAE